MFEPKQDESGASKATTGRTRRRVLAGAAATATAGTIMVLVSIGTATDASAAPQPKVTLCHAKPADTAKNGWVEITISANAVIHAGHAFEHDADIIPPFNFKGGSFPGKNLTTVFDGSLGRDILANDCVPPVVTTTATNTPTNTVTNTVTATNTVTNTATATVTNTATATVTATNGNQGEATSAAPIPVAVQAGLHNPVQNAGLKAWGTVLILLGGMAGLIAGAWPTRRRRVH